MTKEEMIDKFMLKNNYDVIQKHIQDAMKEGKHYIYVGKEGFDLSPDWTCLDETKYKLEDDGFAIRQVNYDEWEISW